MPRLAIVGAGICGLLTAYTAFKNGFEVIVYEAEREVGRGASRFNSGVIHVLQPPFNSLKSKLCIEGNRMYRGLSEEIGFKIRYMKAYLVYTGIFSKIASPIATYYLRSKGFRVRKVGRKEVKESCKHISNDIKGGVEVDGYAVVEPLEVLNRLYRRLSEEGIEFRLGDRVEKIEINNKVTVLNRSGEDEYDYIVISAGSDTRRVASYIDDNIPRQRLALGVIAATRLECDAIIARLEIFSRDKYTKGGGIIPSVKKGVTLFGPDFHWIEKPINSYLGEEDGLKVVKLYLDLIDTQPELIEVYGGTRVINWPVDDFIIKFLYDKVAILYGIDSPGFTAAPAIADMVINKFR